MVGDSWRILTLESEEELVMVEIGMAMREERGVVGGGGLGGSGFEL